MSFQDNLARVRANIAAAAREVGRDPADITLVAATKTQSDETIRAAIAAGITVCGENRVQEMTAHLDAGVFDQTGLHFIGHLQTNKVRFVVGRVDMIESVDSFRLLDAIEKQAERLHLVQDVLLEVNIGGEENKSGVAPGETDELALYAFSLPYVRLRGLMSVPPAGSGGSNRIFFREMYQLYVDIARKMEDNTDINCLSMGMSGDYEDAVRAGATHVRVGTALFGPRVSTECKI